MSSKTPTGETVPDVLPLLSAGRHRSPRRGACFMEMASYLAGERWSDHPACTHPLLATAARSVNDRTSDAARPRLAVLVPSVVGLTSSDPHLDPRLVRAAAAHALPLAAEARQRALAVGVLTSDRVLAGLDGRDPTRLEPATLTALTAAPDAHRWAQRFAGEQALSTRGVSARAFARETAPHVVALAVAGLADAAPLDVDDRLHALLADLVEVGGAHVDARSGAPSAERWDDVVRLTRR